MSEIANKGKRENFETENKRASQADTPINFNRSHLLPKKKVSEFPPPPLPKIESLIIPNTVIDSFFRNHVYDALFKIILCLSFVCLSLYVCL